MSRPLRIFLCCQQDLQAHAVPAYRFWATYFRNSFAETGHTCLEAPGCDWAEGLLPLTADQREQWKRSTWQRALEWIQREHAVRPIDLFLSYLYPNQVDLASIRELKSLGIATVNFYCDNVRQFRRIPAEFGVFDLNWVPEQAALPLYKRAGYAYLHAPMACWIPAKYRFVPVEEGYPPSFVGTSDELRRRLFAKAYELGLTMEIHGAGWIGEAGTPSGPAPGIGRGMIFNQVDFARDHGLVAWVRKVASSLRPSPPLDFDFKPWTKGPTESDEYWQILRNSRVCVGVNRFPSFRHPASRPGRYSRLRDLEAPMAGAVYLTEDAEGLDQLYEIGREIEVYRNAAELVAKVEELERDPAKRLRLRAAGQRRALVDHTIEQTIKRIVARLGVGGVI